MSINGRMDKLIHLYRGILHTYFFNELKLYSTRCISLMNNIGQKKSATEEYILCNSVYVNFKNRQNYCW